MDKIDDEVVEASISAWCKNHNNKKHEDFIRAAIRAAVLAEREACATSADFFDGGENDESDKTARAIATAIRARGNGVENG